MCSSSFPLADQTGLELAAVSARHGGRRWKKQARHCESSSLVTLSPVDCGKRARDYTGAGISDVVVESCKRVCMSSPTTTLVASSDSTVVAVFQPRRSP
ncbi:hypothetical protein HYC85_005457 [Camellia sinensis]|uniref:Uncharacterized protein n=1 Tax=Camellia sinensis TaxID=4442 RepID=A0A7J7HZK2_CAMSI|nr:hypothetical protein HYC85_005457 [Camellia sinensis]